MSVFQYYYGHPPPESVSGVNAGECKEGQKSCYNVGCERCRKDYLKRFVFNAELFESNELFDEMYHDSSFDAYALATPNTAARNAVNPNDARNAVNPNDAPTTTHNALAANELEMLPA